MDLRGMETQPKQPQSTGNGLGWERPSASPTNLQREIIQLWGQADIAAIKAVIKAAITPTKAALLA